MKVLEKLEKKKNKLEDYIQTVAFSSLHVIIDADPHIGKGNTLRHVYVLKMIYLGINY
jgi:hypothetical protein